MVILRSMSPIRPSPPVVGFDTSAEGRHEPEATITVTWRAEPDRTQALAVDHTVLPPSGAESGGVVERPSGGASTVDQVLRLAHLLRHARVPRKGGQLNVGNRQK